jgi:hypothetical protein
MAKYDDVFFSAGTLEVFVNSTHSVGMHSTAGCRSCARPQKPFTKNSLLKSPAVVVDLEFASFRRGGQALYYMKTQGSYTIRRVVYVGGLNKEPPAVIKKDGNKFKLESSSSSVDPDDGAAPPCRSNGAVAMTHSSPSPR